MFAPNKHRDIELNGHLDRKTENTGVAMPAHVAHEFKSETVEFFENLNAWPHDNVVHIKLVTHAHQVLFALGKIIVGVISNQQGLEAKHFGNIVGLIVAVFAAAYRNNTIVVTAIFNAILFHDFFHNHSTLIPVNFFFLFGNPATAADSPVIKGKFYGGGFGVNAFSTPAH